MRLPGGGRCYDRRVVVAPALGRLTDDQRAIRDAVRTLARERVAPRAAEIDRSAEFPEDLRVLLAEQGILADMDARTEAARQLLYTACEEIERGAPDAGRWSALCKLVAGDAAMAVTTDAVHVLGGYGYLDDFPVERMMRDAKITQLYEGTQQCRPCRRSVPRRWRIARPRPSWPPGSSRSRQPCSSAPHTSC